MKKINVEPIGARRTAFTLIELLVVIAIIAILAGLLLPALARAKNKAKIAEDRNNKKQMQLCVNMYLGDFQDTIMPNAPIGSGFAGWVDGSEDWHSSGANTNIVLYNSSVLGPYVANNVKVYRTPFDNINSDNGQRVRSVSMNGQVGTTIGSDRDNKGWQHYLKISDMVSPQPSDIWIFCNENMWSLEDGYMQMKLDAPDFPNVPAAYCDNGNVFSFADGHVEYEKWKYNANGIGMIACPYAYNVTGNGAHWPSSVQDGDYAWVKYHTASKSNNFAF